jgi:ADP-ribose pyrophosphatase
MNDMDFYEKQLFSECIFDGKILHVYKDDIELPDKTLGSRELIRHVGGVCILPLTDEGDVICVRQFRYPFGRVILEIPAGKLDSNEEDHRDAALRELREETGCSPKKLTYIGTMYGSPAILEEKIYMYIAEGLTEGEMDLDDDEFVEVVRIPLKEMYKMVMSGIIKDAKTQVAVLKAYAYINGEEIDVKE